MDEFLRSSALLFSLLNPFLLSVVLRGTMKDMNRRDFAGVLLRSMFIAGPVFAVFSLTGEALFRDILHVHYSSFMVFGGILFLTIGLKFAVNGAEAITQLRGEPSHVAGAVAMPFMIGPGSISAAILCGAKLSAPLGVLAVFTAVGASVSCIFVLKIAHDHVLRRNAALIERYTDLVGRLSALWIGTFAMEMILTGLGRWIARLQ